MNVFIHANSIKSDKKTLVRMYNMAIVLGLPIYTAINVCDILNIASESCIHLMGEFLSISYRIQ
jgi:hypothetical protein